MDKSSLSIRRVKNFSKVPNRLINAKEKFSWGVLSRNGLNVGPYALLLFLFLTFTPISCPTHIDLLNTNGQSVWPTYTDLLLGCTLYHVVSMGLGIVLHELTGSFGYYQIYRVGQ